MAEKGETEDQSSVVVNIKTTKEKLEVKVAPGKTVKEVYNVTPDHVMYNSIYLAQVASKREVR